MKELQLQKNRIMRRIYLAYVMRKASQPVIIELIALIALVLLSSLFVSVYHVIVNLSALHNPSALYFFISDAFVKTELIVKTLFVVGGIISLLFLYEIIRGISRPIISGIVKLRSS